MVDSYVIGAKENSDELFLLGTSTKIFSKFHKKDSTERFYYSNTKANLSELIVKIRYRSMSSLDENIYELVFASKLTPINKRKTIKDN